MKLDPKLALRLQFLTRVVRKECSHRRGRKHDLGVRKQMGKMIEADLHFFKSGITGTNAALYCGIQIET